MLIGHRLGLGAPLPKDIPDGDRRRQELSSNDRLRKHLLGKDFPRLQAGALEKRGMSSGGHQSLAKARPAPLKRILAEDEDEDEEGGRSSLGKSKRQGVRVESVDGVNEDDGDTRASSSLKSSPRGTKAGRKPAYNYLDEVLAERSQKRKRKRNKKRKKQSGDLQFQ